MLPRKLLPFHPLAPIGPVPPMEGFQRRALLLMLGPISLLAFLRAISTFANSASQLARTVTNIAMEKVTSITALPQPCINLPELC